jgi:hypothetical protein
MSRKSRLTAEVLISSRLGLGMRLPEHNDCELTKNLNISTEETGLIRLSMRQMLAKQRSKYFSLR